MDDAENELNQISENNQEHHEVLTLRWHAAAARNDWERALSIARRSIELAPQHAENWVHQSYSLHELHRTEEALEELLQVAPRFSDTGIIPYNLACYHCQLGNLDEARIWLKRAMKVQGRKSILAMAMDDSDLLPLKAELARLGRD